MKKITMMSLIASLAIGTSVNASSLAEAFAASKVKGEIKAQYFDVSPTLYVVTPGTPPTLAPDGKSDTISAIGGNLNLVTGSFNGFKAGVTFQTSNILDVSYKNNNDFAGTMDASGSVMSESYLEYSLNNSSIKAGRQYITTPLVAGSGSRMIKQSFEAYVLTNSDLPDTTLIAAYVTKFQGRTDNAGSPGKFVSVEDGAYTIYAKNSSIKDLTLRAQYLDVNGNTSASDKDSLYVDAAYNISGLKLEAQVIKSTNGTTDGQLLGVRASGNVAMFNLTGIYTSTNSDGKVFSGLGSGADGSFTALPVHGGGVTYEKDTNTGVFVAATKIAGATIVAYYGNVKTDLSSAVGYTELDAIGGFIHYPFNKSFSAKVMYESVDFDTTSDNDDIIRVYTSYKF